MPIYRTLNQNFFKKWSPKMAYVLGFFAADGNMIINNRGAHFMEFVSTDKSIIVKIKNALCSNHKISCRKRDKKWKPAYRLQIGSKEIFSDLVGLGMMPAKSNIIKLPNIPDDYFNDFLRGYFDGDGHVSVSTYRRKGRKSKSTIIITGFTSGSRKFLEELKLILENHKVAVGGSLYTTNGHHLCFSTRDSLRLYNFMYQKEKGLYLRRKKDTFKHYFNNFLGA